jgi:nitrite reductase/ring-hydroxylating ferredoxin subunit/uncharacterized membrane protein
MRSKASILGHPIHPALIPFPFAFLTGAFAFDLWGWYFQQQGAWTMAGHLALVGVAAALVAALPGIIDYAYTVPPNSSGKRYATQHVAFNLGAVVLFVIALIARRYAPLGDGLTLSLEAVATAALVRGGWLGGTLVNRHQIGVDHRYAEAGKWREQHVKPGGAEGIAVARVNELRVNQMKLIQVNGRRIVLARTENGYTAFDDRCTHKGGPLAGGAMICGTVQCPWHGSQFAAATGRVTAGPATKEIATYDVREENGRVWLRP